MRVDGFDPAHAGVRFTRQRGRGRAALRLHRRLRRLPRRLPARRFRRACSPSTSASIPSRGSASSPRRAPVARRAGLREPRARLRALQHALARAHAALPAGRARRGRWRAGPTSASGTSSHARFEGERRLAPERGAGAREGRHRHAQLRGRADAASGGSSSRATRRTSCRRRARKGMNLAVADVCVLARALRALLPQRRRRRCSSAYSATCLARVWRAEHFSWWMTSMLHRFPDDDTFQHACSSPSSTTWSRPAPPRPRSPRTTSACPLSGGKRTEVRIVHTESSPGG